MSVIKSVKWNGGNRNFSAVIQDRWLICFLSFFLPSSIYFFWYVCLLVILQKICIQIFSYECFLIIFFFSFFFLNSLIFEHIFCLWFQTASLLYDVFVLFNLLLFYEHYELNRLSINESVSILETFRRIFPDGEPKNLTSYLQVLEQTGKTGINLR